ncbi:MAG: carbamoyltransferase C-terminal domain-containing protein [Candidatus Alcyoniella australis]|nr:carbamoyltransferase C-terminal domain-containing protein [Candidatus Alcyoniella australis]
MKILALSDNHGSGATLLDGDRVLLAVNQERLDRRKNSGEFPWQTIDAVLQSAGWSPQDVDLVALASNFTPSFPLRLFNRRHERMRRNAGQFSYLFNLYILYQVAALSLPPTWQLDMLLSKLLISRRLRARGFKAPLRFVEHHTSHAAAAFLTSPFSEATVITMDAMGDGLSVTVSVGRPDGSLDRVFRQKGLCSLSSYYSRATEFLGFTPNRHEGKLTGLAAYGDPFPLLDQMNRLLHFRSPGLSRLNYCLKQSPRLGHYRELRRHSREDVAAALQLNLEREAVKFVRHWVEITGVRNVALAGGVFENVKLNQRIHELDSVEQIYIFPNMSDSGLAYGAALYAAGLEPHPLPTVYTGFEFDARSIERAAAQWPHGVEQPENMEHEAAALLAKGKVVARFCDRMEYGPRALGNRSILYSAVDPAVNDWLNRRLKRTEFMPFAPATLVEHADECFNGVGGAEFTARFMNICFNCTPFTRERTPGVVHVDNTARPQLVAEQDNPSYYRTLRRYHELTGLPTLINTSFNMHEEPIVCTPEDAIRSFHEGHLDYLVLGHLLLKGPEADREKGA